MPRTKIILNKGPREWVAVVDGVKLQEQELETLYSTAASFGYPVFMRTDMFSGKHSYRNTCHVCRQADLLYHIFNLVDKSFAFDIGMDALVFREHLDLVSAFSAFHGLPVAKERRYFAEDGEVMVHHPYWPESAITFTRTSPEVDNWAEKLRGLNTETPAEVELLTEYACQISEVLEGPWSIDFAQAKDGTWYFIDAAEAMKSWIHPDYADQVSWK